MSTPVSSSRYTDDLLGGLGSTALAIPLFGFLNYGASLLYPLLLAWFAYGAVIAVTRPARMTRVYLFGNLGVLGATLIDFVAMWIILVSVGQPDTAVSRPAYLAVVLAGLVVGVVLGSRRHRTPALQR